MTEERPGPPPRRHEPLAPAVPACRGCSVGAVFDVIPRTRRRLDQANVGKAVLADYRMSRGRTCAWQTWEHYRGTTALVLSGTIGRRIARLHRSPVCVGTGDTATACATSQLALEPGCQDGEHARWFIMGQALPPEEVQERFQLPTKPAGDANQKSSPMTRLLHASTVGRAPNLTMVLCYYERPTWMRPEGAYVCIVGGAVVAQGPWPFPFTDRLNCVIVRE
jgi:hypothetical protein